MRQIEVRFHVIIQNLAIPSFFATFFLENLEIFSQEDWLETFYHLLGRNFYLLLIFFHWVSGLPKIHFNNVDPL